MSSLGSGRLLRAKYFHSRRVVGSRYFDQLIVVRELPFLRRLSGWQGQINWHEVNHIWAAVFVALLKGPNVYWQSSWQANSALTSPTNNKAT